MYAAYEEEKKKEDEESAFISFYLCIRHCCEEPTGREREIADNSFLPNILGSRGAVSQNRVDCGTWLGLNICSYRCVCVSARVCVRADNSSPIGIQRRELQDLAAPFPRMGSQSRDCARLWRAR